MCVCAGVGQRGGCMAMVWWWWAEERDDQARTHRTAPQLRDGRITGAGAQGRPRQRQGCNHGAVRLWKEAIYAAVAGK